MTKKPDYNQIARNGSKALGDYEFHKKEYRP
jgi:hypothetical protein